jgi:hypothetical protein
MKRKMYKRILYVFTALLLFASCSSRDKANTIVSGLAVDYSGKTIYISKVLPSKRVLVDSALVDTLGNFAFRLTLVNPDFFEISDKPSKNGIVIIASPSEQIEVNLARGESWNGADVKGSSGFSLLKTLSDSLCNLRGRLHSIQRQFDTLKYSYRYDSLRRVIKQSFNGQITNYRFFLRNFVVQNKGSLASIPALYQRIDSASYMLNEKTDLRYFLLVDSILYRKYPESAMVKVFHAKMQSIRYQLNNQKLNRESIVEGSLAHEFNLKSLGGDTVSLAKLRGRYVLLCFWASWAKPSVAENGRLVEIYKKYKPYGFEIVQVSLDRNLKELDRAIFPDMRQWKHCSEFRMWNSSIVKDYRVACIPSNFIINRQGIVVAKNVLGKSLFDTLRWYLVRPYLMRRDTTKTQSTPLENTSDQ